MGGSSKSVPVIVRFTLPGSVDSKLKEDSDSQDNVSFRMKGKIDSKYVNGVEIRRGGKWIELSYDELMKKG